MELIVIATIIVAIILMFLLIYESRQLKHNTAMMNLFIEANAEIFAVVNGNANATREMADRLDNQERVIEFYKIVLDAHAHILKVYSPALTFLEKPISTKIENLENL